MGWETVSWESLAFAQLIIIFFSGRNKNSQKIRSQCYKASVSICNLRLDFGPKETALNASHCLKFSTKQRNVTNQMLDALHATGREQYHYLDSPGEVNLKGQFMLNLKIDLS